MLALAGPAGIKAGRVKVEVEALGRGVTMTKILQAVRALTKNAVAKPVPMDKSIKVIPGGVHHYRTLAEIKRMA